MHMRRAETSCDQPNNSQGNAEVTGGKNPLTRGYWGTHPKWYIVRHVERTKELKDKKEEDKVCGKKRKKSQLQILKVTRDI